MEDNLVSVITAAYNCETTIVETIESVLGQSYNNWEMIIVNDCSIDNTVKLVEEYVKRDPRIQLISLGENSGSAVARNTGIECAKGRYIAILDSDDLWKPKKLQQQLEFMIRNDYAFTFTKYDTFRTSSDVIRKEFSVPKSMSYSQYLKNTAIGCLTVMVDRKQIPDFHMESGYLEDILTWMFYLRNGVVAYGFDENLASYRIAANSKSSNKYKNALRYYQCLKMQPELGCFRRLYCEVGYLYNAIKKRVFSKKIIIDNK